MTTFEFSAIGTSWHIEVYGEHTSAQEAALLTQIRERIEKFEAVYSRFRPDSVVGRIARESGTFAFPADSERLFALYRDFYLRTNGYFTPLIGRMLVDAGYDAGYSLAQKKKLEAPPAWDDVMEYRAPNLIVKEPIALDFGAAGKGYAIDLIGELLESVGYHDYLIDAGGDILRTTSAHSDTPARIGLEDPNHTDQIIGIYSLVHGSICGSSGNRRTWGDFTHIMNPKSLSSPRDIIAVWVAAHTAAVADALTTCLFFVDPHTLLDAYSFEYLIMHHDRSIQKSQGFSSEIFLK